ncbi:MAG: SGNH/GDSL hydrolase family protein [Candidatus Zhuqueibacterota bacterium]
MMKLKKRTILFLLMPFLGLNATRVPAQEPRLVNILPAQRDSMLSWYDAHDFTVLGRGWDEPQRNFERLPAEAETLVTEAVWRLSHHTSGLYVQFATNATEIHVRWTLLHNSLAMPHMPATGVSGIDLYTQSADGTWRWLGNGRPSGFPVNKARLVQNLPPASRRMMLYLPLYNGVSSVEIGLPQQASVWAFIATNPPHRKPIVFYGTSITQGGCASRPGMSATSILGRRLDAPIINLGFSGAGKMEPALAELLGEIDAALYVIDCLPNMDVQLIQERVEPFIETLRRARAETPILLVEGRAFQNAHELPETATKIKSQWLALRTAYENLTGKGIQNLHYAYGQNQLGDDGEATVDGSHPTDLGFMRQADFFEPMLRAILNYHQE